MKNKSPGIVDLSVEFYTCFCGEKKKQPGKHFYNALNKFLQLRFNISMNATTKRLPLFSLDEYRKLHGELSAGITQNMHARIYV